MINSRLCGMFKFYADNSRRLCTSPQFSQFQSAVSLKNLYPNSNLDVTTAQKVPDGSNDKFSGYIPMDKLQVTYSRSSGPGGQNVHKVNTKVDVRFKLSDAEWLSPVLKEKVAEKFKTSITVDGFFVIRSDNTRSQQLNLASALDKLRNMIHSASFVPPPPAAENIERARRRHEAAVRERLRLKKHRSLIKQDRQAPEATY